jgi:hypothetical protein
MVIRSSDRLHLTSLRRKFPLIDVFVASDDYGTLIIDDGRLSLASVVVGKSAPHRVGWVQTQATFSFVVGPREVVAGASYPFVVFDLQLGGLGRLYALRSPKRRNENAGAASSINAKAT